MDRIEGFILVGGASRRMGTDKSSLLLGDRTFTEQIAGALSAITGPVVLVGDHRTTPDFRSTTDIYTNWGALGGLHAALVTCKSDWAVVVACDLPFVTTALFEHMAGLRKGFEAVAPVQPDGRPQPLCALYRIEPGLREAERLIEAGERRPVALLESVKTRWVLPGELHSLDGADRFFDNINTPRDYARATAKESLTQATRTTHGS